MRRTLGVGVALALASCGPTPDGFTLLFLGRSPTAQTAPHVTWAPDPDRSRLVAFDEKLHIVRTIADPRLATPMAVTAVGQNRLLVTERTGEGVLFDVDAARPLREWESPFPAALYASDGDHIVAARSPYFVQFVAEQGSEPLLWRLDTLGHARSEE